MSNYEKQEKIKQLAAQINARLQFIRVFKPRKVKDGKNYINLPGWA